MNKKVFLYTFFLLLFGLCDIIHGSNSNGPVIYHYDAPESDSDIDSDSDEDYDPKDFEAYSDYKIENAATPSTPNNNGGRSNASIYLGIAVVTIIGALAHSMYEWYEQCKHALEKRIPTAEKLASHYKLAKTKLVG